MLENGNIFKICKFLNFICSIQIVKLGPLKSFLALHYNPSIKLPARVRDCKGFFMGVYLMWIS